MNSVVYPDWINAVIDWNRPIPRIEERMALAVELAHASVAAGGGPFGAIITDAAGNPISCGVNMVRLTNDSTAHAEVLAIRNAQQRLQTIELDQTPLGPLSLFSSTSPCIMCYGAIWWSRLSEVYCATGAADAERIGFSEGPLSENLWDEIAKVKKIKVTRGFGSSPRAREVFEAFQKSGGKLY